MTVGRDFKRGDVRALPNDFGSSRVHEGIASSDPNDLRVLVTADEAFPVFERAFLGAEKEITAGFRIFDLQTKLRSDEARAIGEDWFDLMVHTLHRGIAVRMVLSDFDPLFGADLHRLTWRSIRQFHAAREVAEGGEMEIVADLHSAQVGLFPRIALQPVVQHTLRKLVGDVNAMDRDERLKFLDESPGLRKFVSRDGERMVVRQRFGPIHPGTHHQKLAVFDNRRLYIGGLDLNERRYDTPDHARQAEWTWHDVQCLIEGPVVQAASEHLSSFLATIDRKSRSRPTRQTFLRTLSKRRRFGFAFMSPRTVAPEIERAHYRGLRTARKLIYLETQFLRHVPLAKALARRGRRRPDLTLIVLLPAAPEDVAFEDNFGRDAQKGEYLQMRSIDILRRGFGDRLLVVSPVQPHRRESDGRDALDHAPLIYVHSKVSIFDESLALVTSANLNGRSMRWDTEAGLALTAPEHVDEVRRQVMGHWLPDDAGADYLDLDTAFERWKDLAARNTAARPRDREGFIVEYDSEAARDWAGAEPVVPDEAV